MIISTDKFSVPFDGFPNAKIVVSKALGNWSTVVEAPEFGGAMLEAIVAKRPDLKPFVDLHLASARDGRPMHAFDNGVYWLTGAIPETHSFYTYHGANDNSHTTEDCLEILCNLWRCDTDHVAGLIESVKTYAINAAASNTDRETVVEAIGELVATFITQQYNRWTDETIAALNLFDKFFNT